MVLVGLGWMLNRYTLLQSDLGVVFGAGYTDIKARMPLYTIESFIFFAAAVVLVANVFIRRWRLLIIVGVLWLALSALGPAYPATVQQFTVEPNEFIVEKPYIENNIRYTRYAYGLDKIKEQEYSATGRSRRTTSPTTPTSSHNVRLWDYRPLLRTYSQLQEIRLYYTFNEVDVDRYTIDGDTAPGDARRPRTERGRAGRTGPDLDQPPPDLHARLRPGPQPVNEVSEEGLAQPARSRHPAGQ